MSKRKLYTAHSVITALALSMLSPSSFKAKIEGNIETYKILKKEILNIPNIDCPNTKPVGNLVCRVGQVDVGVIYEETQKPTYVILTISDRYSGRSS